MLICLRHRYRRLFRDKARPFVRSAEVTLAKGGEPRTFLTSRDLLSVLSWQRAYSLCHFSLQLPLPTKVFLPQRDFIVATTDGEYVPTQAPTDSPKHRVEV